LPVSTPDVELYFDPVCPFCWQTSKWLRQVQRLKGLDVGYRFISLQFLNESIGYEDRGETYAQAHRQGTRLLRVAAAVREAHGHDAVGRLYEAMGEAMWESDVSGIDAFDDILAHHAAGADIPAILRSVGLSEEFASAADDGIHDAILRKETDQALERAGSDVGTPILSFSPPDGPAFFGPVISDLPSDEDAVGLYDAIVKVATWPGFAELKRSLRTLPDVALMQKMRDDAAA
jgi:predicted DCC family thiol-disulfide oxidoreductase YuxK